MRTHCIQITAFATALALFSAGVVAEERTCTTTIAALTLDNIRVPPGASCTLNGTRAKGTVKVGNGASLFANGAQIAGNVQAEGARQVVLRRSSFVGGSVQIKQGSGATIANARIEGDLQFDENTTRIVATENRIGGNLQAVKNFGGLLLAGNRMDGNLQCKENRPAPTGRGNRAASKEDQCSGL